MKPTEQQNNDARAENTDDRNLTPRQIQKRKKMMIFPLFFLAFSGCMWLIFAPSRQPEQSVAGFNTELPTPETDGIVSDKREAYMQEDFERTQRTKMQSLQDFAWEPTEEDLSGPVSHPGTVLPRRFPFGRRCPCGYRPANREFLRGDSRRRG